MSQKGVTQYLESQVQLLGVDSERLKKLKDDILSRKEEVKKAIFSEKLKVPETQRPLSSYLQKLQSKQELTKQINELVRNQRLQEAEKMKQLLKEKLEAVQSSIVVLEALEEEREKQLQEEKRIARIKETRDKYLKKEGIQEQSKINQQAALFAKKQAEEQKLRRKLYKQQMKESKNKLTRRLKNLEKRKEKEREKEKEERLKRLQEKHMELEKRQQEREQLLEKEKEEMKNKGQNKPLYLSIQEKYQAQILMPELERRKEELKKRREFFQSTKSSDILEHVKNHDARIAELKRQKERERKQKNLTSRTSFEHVNYTPTDFNKLLEKERQKREEEQKKKQKIQELLAKRSRYGEVVKSTFAPLPNLNKKIELEKLNEASKTKPREVRISEIKAQAKEWIYLESQLKKQYFQHTEKMENEESQIQQKEREYLSLNRKIKKEKMTSYSLHSLLRINTKIIFMRCKQKSIKSQKKEKMYQKIGIVSFNGNLYLKTLPQIKLQ